MAGSVLLARTRRNSLRSALGVVCRRTLVQLPWETLAVLRHFAMSSRMVLDALPNRRAMALHETPASAIPTARNFSSLDICRTIVTFFFCSLNSVQRNLLYYSPIRQFIDNYSHPNVPRCSSAADMCGGCQAGFDYYSARCAPRNEGRTKSLRNFR